MRLTDLRRAGAARARGDEREEQRASRWLALAPGLHPLRFPTPGLYRLEGEGWERDLAVNLPQVEESDLQRLPQADPRPVSVPEARAEEEPPPTVWLLLGLLAAGLLVLEFGLYTR